MGNTFLGRLLGPREQRSMSLADFMDSDLASSAVGNINQGNATRIATVMACQRLLVDAVSTLPTAPYIRAGGQRRPFYPYPAWMNAPHGARDPNFSSIDYFADVASSLLQDGNAFTLAMPRADEYATEVWVLDPRKVEVKREPSGRVTYTVRADNGRTDVFDAQNVVHTRRVGRPGELRGLSPVDEARVLLGYAVSAQTWGKAWYDGGGVPSGVLEFAGELTKEQRDELKKEWQKQHGGADKVRTGLLTGGITYKSVSPTFEQAQWIESMRFSAEQIGAIYGVPLHKLGIATPGAMSYASVEASERAFVIDTLRPLTIIVARAHDRLLPGPATYLNMDLRGRLEGDTQARAAFYASMFNVGAMSQNDIRAKEDLPPVDGGDVYRVPLNLGAASASTDIALGEKAKVAGALVLAGYDLAEAAGIVGLPVPAAEPDEPADAPDAPDAGDMPAPARSEPVVFNLNVDSARFDMPPNPAPVVTVEAPIVNVPAPIVNIPPPAREPRWTRKIVERDADGRPIGVIERRYDVEDE